jgi:hypothetical protein
MHTRSDVSVLAVSCHCVDVQVVSGVHPRSLYMFGAALWNCVSKLHAVSALHTRSEVPVALVEVQSPVALASGALVGNMHVVCA